MIKLGNLLKEIEVGTFGNPYEENERECFRKLIPKVGFLTPLYLKLGKYNVSGLEKGISLPWDEGKDKLSTKTRKNAEELFITHLKSTPKTVMIGKVPDRCAFSFYIIGEYNNETVILARKETSSYMAGQTYLITKDNKIQLNKWLDAIRRTGTPSSIKKPSFHFILDNDGDVTYLDDATGDRIGFTPINDKTLRHRVQLEGTKYENVPASFKSNYANDPAKLLYYITGMPKGLNYEMGEYFKLLKQIEKRNIKIEEFQLSGDINDDVFLIMFLNYDSVKPYLENENK
jgi:hypothetical protein